MVEFKGELSEETKHKAFLYQQRKTATISLVVGIVFACLTLLYAFLFGFNLKNLFSDDSIFLFLFLMSAVTLIIALIYYVKPVSKDLVQKKYDFSIVFDGSKVVYTPISASYGKREFGTYMINKFVEFEDFYYLITEGRREPYICEKKLLVEGTLDEFNAVLKNAKFKKVETPVKNVAGTDLQQEGGAQGDNAQANLSGEQKVESTLARTRFGRKIRQRVPREKEYRWAIATIVCALLSVALVHPFLTVGFSAIDVLIPRVASFFFSHVVEFFTAIFALVGTVVSSVFIVGGVLLLMPIAGLLSLIFAIIQLTRNRRWWSWLSLAVSLLSIAAIFVQIATFN